jgi:hypothetical protein
VKTTLTSDGLKKRISTILALSALLFTGAQLPAQDRAFGARYATCYWIPHPQGKFSIDDESSRSLEQIPVSLDFVKKVLSESNE